MKGHDSSLEASSPGRVGVRAAVKSRRHPLKITELNLSYCREGSLFGFSKINVKDNLGHTTPIRVFAAIAASEVKEIPYIAFHGRTLNCPWPRWEKKSGSMIGSQYAGEN